MAHSPRFVKLVDELRPNVAEIAPEEVRARQERGEKFVLIDVREESEFNAGSVVGSEHHSKGTIERDIEKVVPDADTEIILYCGGGFRSIIAASALHQMGYTNVKSMAGGWRGWIAREYPTK